MPKAVVLEKGAAGEIGYPLKLVEVPRPSPRESELLVRVIAAGLNHRDVFIRQNLYPGIALGVPLLADGVGMVESTGSAALESSWIGKRVVLAPGRGWTSSPEGPEPVNGPYAILGGTKHCPVGTLQEFVAIGAAEVEEAPDHLDDAQAAALPLAGLTAYRALFAKSGNAKPGHNILITGVGGGVALIALQFACAAGCSVFVTSGSERKLEEAKRLGASGGTLYKGDEWEKAIRDQLPADRKYVDAVIDGAGGDMVERATKLLKPGGVIVSYGMTLGPVLPFSMRAVTRNIELRGSTMGSRREFSEMIDFVRTKRIVPIVSRIVKGIEDLEAVDSLFEDLRTGRQFGKLVVYIKNDGEHANSSKL